MLDTSKSAFTLDRNSQGEEKRERNGRNKRGRGCAEALIRPGPIICHFKQSSKAASGDSLSAIKQRRSKQPEIDD